MGGHHHSMLLWWVQGAGGRLLVRVCACVHVAFTKSA